MTCNDQWLNSILLSALLKFWALVLNQKCPNKCVFYCFYGFICDFLEFSLLKSSKLFTAHRFQWDTKFKHAKSRVCKGSFFDFFKFVFYHCKNPGSIDFPEKQGPAEVKYLLRMCQILRNFTKGNVRKFTVSFAFCASIYRYFYLWPKWLINDLLSRPGLSCR